MPLRADRINKELLEGADRPVPDWIRKKQSAKEMLGRGGGGAKGAAAAMSQGKGVGSDLKERNILDSHNTRKKFKSKEAQARDEERAQRRDRNKVGNRIQDYPYELRALPVSRNSAVAQFAISHGSHKRWIDDGVLAEAEAEADKVSLLQ